MSFLVNSHILRNTLPDLLKSYWKLDEASGNSADSVGSNTLTPDNAPVSMTGQVGNGRAFVAASQQRLKVAPSGLAPGTSDFTISWWFRHASVTNASLVSWGNQASTNPYIWILLQSTTLRVQFVDGLSGFNTFNSSITFSANVWHHVACVFDRDTILRVYKNGSQAETNTGLTTHQGNFSPAGNFALGNFAPSNSLPLDGGMDEVKFWHRALSAPEVARDYSNGLAGIPLL